MKLSMFCPDCNAKVNFKISNSDILKGYFGSISCTSCQYDLSAEVEEILHDMDIPIDASYDKSFESERQRQFEEALLEQYDE